MDILPDLGAALYGPEQLDDGDAGLNGEGDAPDGGAGGRRPRRSWRWQGIGR